MGELDGIFTLILSMVAVVAGLLKGVQLIMVNTLVKYGIIRPQRRTGDADDDMWPNGYRSLPETLTGLYDEIQRIDGERKA